MRATLKPPSNAISAAQVATDFAQHFGLRVGEGETQLFEKRFDQMIVARAGQSGGAGLKSSAAPLYLHLQFNKLVEREPSPGDLRVRDLVREMQQANRAGARNGSGRQRHPAGGGAG